MPDLIQRHPSNPVLAADHCPYDATLVFNAGVCKWAGRYAMIFRNDWGDFRAPGGGGNHGTKLGIAWSDDGVDWSVEGREITLPKPEGVRRNYDPRLTVLDGRAYLCFAQDTAWGVRGGLAVSDDPALGEWEVLSLTLPDNRNTVLFPEKVNGRFARLERPFPVYGNPREGHAFDVWYGESPDGIHWGGYELVIDRDAFPWCNDKIGPGAPPIRTDAGWLALVHVVDTDDDRKLLGWEPWGWKKRYTIAAVLLDLDRPWRVLGYSRQPVMVPETEDELDGFRGSVLFPGGLLDEGDGTVKIYYGGADTVECLATAKIDDLVATCEPV